MKSLFRVEEASMLKQSKLNFVAVHPKPIECQNVKTCLRVFCDETATALQAHTGIDSMDTVGTFRFLRRIVCTAGKIWLLAIGPA